MRSWAHLLLTLGAALAVFWLGFDGGTYELESRATLAIAVWWGILLAVVLGLWPLVTPPRGAILTGGLIAVFALFAGASIAWAESAERAFTEFNRAALYLGIFLVAVCAGTRGNVGRWLDGFAIGVTAVGLLALASRCFPDALPSGDVPEFLPAALTRLSYPVEYWNGLGILVALAVPLLLRAATTRHHPAWRGLALAPLPAFAAVFYFTSSRGAFATALVAVIAFLVLTPRRWPAAAAVALAGAASAASILIVTRQDALVNDPLGPAAADEGRSVALLILLLSAGVALAYAAGVRLVPVRLRIPSALGWATALAAVAAAIVVVAASHPIERFEAFKGPPVPFAEEDFIRAHLLSGNGSGRWQFWGAALDQWQEAPLAGQGSGSYEAWWAQQGTLVTFIRDAHSLYLEALGELGVVGFVLVLGTFVAGVVIGLRRLLAAEGEERLILATLLAAFLAYTVAAGIDWMWELTVVSAVGIATLGFLTGPATAASGRPRLLADPDPGERRSRRRFAAGVAAVAAGWLIICAQAIPFLADIKISDSQAAANRGDGAQALEDATAARNLQPWAASPYLQLALVDEAGGQIAAAGDAIQQAIERDPLDWRLWLVAARIQTKAGNILEARRSLDRAAELNPRSPLFASVT